MKKLLIISFLILSKYINAQNQELVYLEKKIAAFYFEEHLFAEKAREREINLMNRLFKKDSIIQFQLNQVKNYKNDSLIYSINFKDYRGILLNNSLQIKELKTNLKIQKVKTKGALLFFIVATTIAIVK